MKRKYGGGIKRRVFSFSITPDHPDAAVVIPALEQAARGERSADLVAAYASYLRKKQAQSDLPDARHP